VLYPHAVSAASAREMSIVCSSMTHFMFLLFVSGLRDLNVFCNETELHLLCMLLDINDTGQIDYSFIVTGLSYIR